MTKEDKELQLKDLCARFTCRTMVKCNTDGRHEFDEQLSVMHIMNFYQFEIKPYLRPMSSMTEEEKKEYGKVCELDTEILAKHPMNGEPFPALYNSQDWLNAHHFDYRGLIEKGLALEAPEGMYN